jgi:hypothetical protein
MRNVRNKKVFNRASNRKKKPAPKKPNQVLPETPDAGRTGIDSVSAGISMEPSETIPQLLAAEFERFREWKFLCPACKELLRDLESKVFDLGLPPLVSNYTGIQLEQLTTGDDEMLPAIGDSTTGQRGRQAGQIPYLKNEHLTSDPRAAKIMGVRAEEKGKFGPAVVLKLSMSGHTFLWTVRTKNPNYKTLLEKFGQNENDWAGQTILLALAQDDFSENYFPHVTFPTPERKADRK